VKKKFLAKSVGCDEAYCEWFECPVCKCTDIMIDHEFCPSCGVPMKPDYKEPKEPKPRKLPPETKEVKALIKELKKK